MQQNFWHSIPKPIIGLSPMDGVTDFPYRQIMVKYGHPSVVFTEFTAAEGIRAGAEKLLEELRFSPSEHPIVAQLFGTDPTAFTIAGAVVAALGFDGVDINMGCPSKTILQRGAGAAYINDPVRAQEVITATRKGVKLWVDGCELREIGVPENIIQATLTRNPEQIRNSIPVSVKTRIGYTEPQIDGWIRPLLENELPLITLHGRTFRQLYSGTADWELIEQAAEIAHSTGTLVLGNGDVQGREDALEKVSRYGVNGVLIGRASFGNPWCFSGETPNTELKVEVALEHARLIEENSDNPRGFFRIRKHLSDYVRGIPNAKEYRAELMQVTSTADVERCLKKLLE